MSERPTWRVAQLETCDPFGWHVLDATTAQEVRTRLAGFESMTWQQILIEGSKRNHRVTFDRLDKPAQDRLVALNQDDVDGLVSLGVNARARVWGIPDGACLRLLWWDPEHAVCPSLLRHT